MFDYIELKNCPENFALNCKNYEIKCHECKANETSKYLQYKPINNVINNHPANIVQKSKVQSYSSKGRKMENKLVFNLPLIKSTLASGMVAGNGDAYIDLHNLGKIRIEIKCRFTDRTNIKPSLDEYRSGKTQDIGIYLIHNKIQNKNYFYIKYSTFINIFNYIIAKCYKVHLYGVYNYIEITSYKYKPIHNFNIIDEFNPNNKKLGNRFCDLNSIYIIKNEVGCYVGMIESTFYNLIDLYNSLETKN